ncbi:MAG: undecaprenyldiphospho-muramoylpentapeptide beta-N-acetylglucosaminyltransferase [Gammaproteobacteria bacterium]|nr:undecaprenyldiphospho-muramoylpentapeptide beta-N-acetylglucosaminyltransferase [Gammaproteobacteria bacterium]
MAGRVMVMAGGTGGHVFPALAVALELKQRGHDVFWLGTPDSFEARTVPGYEIEMQFIDIRGVRGKGLLQKIIMPLRLIHAMWQAFKVIRIKRPQLVIGMGGFASGPGGLVARLMNKPLLIQEQNTIPGMTNRWLAKMASKVFQAFRDSFDKGVNAVISGNPVRNELLDLPQPETRICAHGDRPHLLVMGGSLGAQALNETLPLAMALVDETERPLIRHQAGRNKAEVTARAYHNAGINAEVIEFIDDMSGAYKWADLVVCRSGALTVSELTAVGIGSILVPFPHAVDDHQTHNAAFLVDAGAAQLMPQKEMTAQILAGKLKELLPDALRLKTMAAAAQSLAQPKSAQLIADACEELLV